VPRFAGQDLPPEIAKFKDKTVLTNEGMCIFKEDVKLRITLGGKIMSLTFHMPSLDDYASKDFVVESLPFKAGDYEITLNTGLNYYPAGAWKKVGSNP